jgi:hypothetical protein
LFHVELLVSLGDPWRSWNERAAFSTGWEAESGKDFARKFHVVTLEPVKKREKSIQLAVGKISEQG